MLRLNLKIGKKSVYVRACGLLLKMRIELAKIDSIESETNKLNRNC